MRWQIAGLHGLRESWARKRVLSCERPVRARERKEVCIHSSVSPLTISRLVANDQNVSYVAALELRIEKLERRLTYARSRKASVAMHDPDTAQHRDSDPERKGSLATIRAAIHRKAARTRENSDINSLVSDFGYLYVFFPPPSMLMPRRLG